MASMSTLLRLPVCAKLTCYNRELDAREDSN
jgi:hypothetical protein